MRQSRESRDLDMILERDRRAGRNRRNSSAGSMAAGRSGRNERLNDQYTGGAGRNVAAGRSRSGGNVQLWDDGRRSASEVRYRSREAQMQYRRELRRKKRRRQMLLVRSLVGAAAFLFILAVIFGMWKLGSHIWKREAQEDAAEAMQQQEQQLIEENKSEKPMIEENFLTPNEYSRPGEPLPEVTELFVHYTANAGTSAAQNRSYFENLGITGETSASAHFVIGYNGEIIQCLPLDEIGYAVMEHNYNSVSIECCYLREDGKFEDATYESLIKLLGWLMKEYDLGPSAIKRHYDSNGKLCPKYYVEHEDEWEQLIRDVEAYVA